MIRKPFLILLITLAGCSLQPELGELVNDMVVQTSYDPAADFTNFITIAAPVDTLGRVSGTSSDTLILTEYAKEVTKVIRNNINSRGYSLVNKNQDPDLGLTAYIVDDLNVFQSVNYPSYYYPSYYGYYGSYYYNYPSVNTYAYNTAVLVIELVDLRNPDSSGKFKVIWTAYIGDVLNSVDSFEKSYEGIDQAFVQSPYFSRQ